MEKPYKKTSNLVFVYSLEDVSQFIRNYGTNNTLFVLCEMSKSPDFKKSKINFISLDKFINEDTFKKFYNKIYGSSINLFKGFEKYTTHNSLNFGKIMFHDLQFIFSEPIFFLKQINPIIKFYKPTKIFVFKNKNLYRSLIFSYFPKDPIEEVLSFIQNKTKFELKIFHTPQTFKKQFFDLSLRCLRIMQRLIYGLNPYKTKGEKIIFSGAIRNLKSFISSSNLSHKHKFYILMNQDALKSNLSRDLFFINFTPIFKKPARIDSFYKDYNKIIEDKNFRNKFVFFKEDLFELFKGRIKIIFREVFPLMAYYQNKLENFISKDKYEAVYVLSDLELFERVLVNVANKSNIPTFVSQYGVNSFLAPESFWPSDSKYKLIWGEADKDMFLKYGVKKENIIMVGESRFYNYSSKVSKPCKKFLKEVGAPLDKKIVLFVSPYVSINKSRRFIPGLHLTSKEYIKMLKIVFETFKEKPDIHLLISLGQGFSDEPGFIKKMLEEYNLKNITILPPKKYSSHDRINACDAIITGWSTMGLEGMLLEKILLIYKFKFKEDLVEYLKFKAGYGFSNKKELIRLLANLDKIKTKKYIKNQKKYLDYYLKSKKDINAFEKMIEITEMEKHEKNKNNPSS